jgi:hypothetical protein
MKTPAESLLDATWEYGTYIDEGFYHAAEVQAEWHNLLDAIDAHIHSFGLAPGLYVRRIEVDPCPGERDADDERTFARLEFVSHIIPDVVMHLSTEDTDAVPRLDILTSMRRGVGLLDRDWDDLESQVAITRFIDRHNNRAATGSV